MTGTIPITDDLRTSERRKGWHTPDDCPKVNEFQDALDSIFEHLAEGKSRMDGLETKLDANTKTTDENKKDTARILEIVEMGEGLFRGVRFIGKWLRRTIMWIVPPVAAVISLWQMLRPPK